MSKLQMTVLLMAGTIAAPLMAQNSGAGPGDFMVERSLTPPVSSRPRHQVYPNQSWRDGLAVRLKSVKGSRTIPRGKHWTNWLSSSRVNHRFPSQILAAYPLPIIM